MIPTKGAFFAARVFWEAVEKQEPATLQDWELIAHNQKVALAKGFQMLFDLGVLNPISLDSARVLTKHDFKATKGLR